MTRNSFVSIHALVLGLLLVVPPVASNLDAADWPAWRGPTGQGVTEEKNLPLEWGPEKNVRWKLPLPGPGNSTPIVSGKQVFLTQSVSNGRIRMTLCIDREGGAIIWNRSVPFEKSETTHKSNPYCAASPVCDGDRVVVSHGSAGVYCYDMSGEEQWSVDVGKLEHVWGNASSPILQGDLCILNCGPGERTFLLAVNKKTGKEVWRVDIPGGRADGNARTWTGSWSTPLSVREGGEDRILIGYPHEIRSLRPKDGSTVWSARGLGNLVYASPLHGDGVVVSMSGFMGPPLAVRGGGSGDVSKSHFLWAKKKSPQRVGSGVIYEGHVYIVNDPGVAQCIELKTGKVLWEGRVSGQNWSSLLRSGDRLYTIDKAGKATIFRASSEKLEKLAENSLGETTRASIAASNGELFIRTYKHLWCITKN